MIYTIAGVFAALVVIKFVRNLVRYVRMRHYLTRYKEWHSTRDEKFLESKAQVVKLVKDAGVADQHVGVSQHIGYGKLQVGEASVLDNFPHLDSTMSSNAQRLMREATGTYRAWMWEALNPLYWLEAIFFLPRTVLGYLDLPAEGTKVKILNVVWWTVGAVVSFALALYPQEIRMFVDQC